MPQAVAMLRTLCHDGLLVEANQEATAKFFVKHRIVDKCALILNMQAFNLACMFKSPPVSPPNTSGAIVLRQFYTAPWACQIDLRNCYCNSIPATWMASRVILIYKKKDPQDPRNYHLPYVSTAIYGILTRLLLKPITAAMAAGLLDMQHGALSDGNTTTLTARLINDLRKTEGYLALLDVAKVLPSVPRTMITDIIREAGAPEPIIRMITEIYNHTPAVLNLNLCDLPVHPKRGMNEGCPLSPTMFLLYHDVLLRETIFSSPRGTPLHVRGRHSRKGCHENGTHRNAKPTKQHSVPDAAVFQP